MGVALGNPSPARAWPKRAHWFRAAKGFLGAAEEAGVLGAASPLTELSHAVTRMAAVSNVRSTPTVRNATSRVAGSVFRKKRVQLDRQLSGCLACDVGVAAVCDINKCARVGRDSQLDQA